MKSQYFFLDNLPFIRRVRAWLLLSTFSLKITSTIFLGANNLEHLKLVPFADVSAIYFDRVDC